MVWLEDKNLRGGHPQEVWMHKGRGTNKHVGARLSANVTVTCRLGVQYGPFGYSSTSVLGPACAVHVAPHCVYVLSDDPSLPTLGPARGLSLFW